MTPGIPFIVPLSLSWGRLDMESGDPLPPPKVWGDVGVNINKNERNVSYCGWTKSCTTPWFVGIYRGIIIPGFFWVVRNGFCPSTVCNLTI